MESMTFEYPASKTISARVHVGVVGSGDLEVLLEPIQGKTAQVTIRTSVDGFRETWKAVMDRFFSKHEVAVRIEINDAGATPGNVMLRLEQAIEEIRNE